MSYFEFTTTVKKKKSYHTRENRKHGSTIPVEHIIQDGFTFVRMKICAFCIFNICSSRSMAYLS